MCVCPSRAAKNTTQPSFSFQEGNGHIVKVMRLSKICISYARGCVTRPHFLGFCHTNDFGSRYIWIELVLGEINVCGSCYLINFTSRIQFQQECCGGHVGLVLLTYCEILGFWQRRRPTAFEEAEEAPMTTFLNGFLFYLTW